MKERTTWPIGRIATVLESNVTPYYDDLLDWGEQLRLGSVEQPTTLTLFPARSVLLVSTLDFSARYNRVSPIINEHDVVWKGRRKGTDYGVRVSYEGAISMIYEPTLSRHTSWGDERTAPPDWTMTEGRARVKALTKRQDERGREYTDVLLNTGKRLKVMDEQLVGNVRLGEKVDFAELPTREGFAVAALNVVKPASR